MSARLDAYLKRRAAAADCPGPGFEAWIETVDALTDREGQVVEGPRERVRREAWRDGAEWREPTTGFAEPTYGQHLGRVLLGLRNDGSSLPHPTARDIARVVARHREQRGRAWEVVAGGDIRELERFYPYGYGASRRWLSRVAAGVNASGSRIHFEQRFGVDPRTAEGRRVLDEVVYRQIIGDEVT